MIKVVDKGIVGCGNILPMAPTPKVPHNLNFPVDLYAELKNLMEDCGETVFTKMVFKLLKEAIAARRAGA